jgi:hypothetical protein
VRLIAIEGESYKAHHVQVNGGVAPAIRESCVGPARA